MTSLQQKQKRAPILKPQEIPLTTVEAKNVTQLKPLLETYGVAVIALSDISTKDRNNAVKNTTFYQNANAIFKNKPIREPTLAQKLMSQKYIQPKASDAASGMLHQYFTLIHHMLHDSKLLRNVLIQCWKTTPYVQIVYVCPIASNLMIIHQFEGKNIFEVNNGNIKLLSGEIACIAAIAGQRRFVFWDMKDANLKPLYDLWVENGRKNWTKPDPH